MRALATLLGAALLAAGAGGAAQGAPAEPAGRRLLALYKGGEGDSAQINMVKLHAEGHLKNRGYAVTYLDADQPLPDAGAMKGYSGVLTWFKTPKLASARSYPGWLTAQVLAGRKVVILGNFGAFTPDEKYWLPNNYLNEFFHPFGLEYHGEWTDQGAELEAAAKDPGMVEREVPLKLAKINHYYRIASVHPENKPYLIVRRRGREGSESALVVRTPFGGFALESYLFEARPNGSLAWRLNLESFLDEALGYQAKNTGFPTKRILAFHKESEGTSAWDNEIRRFLWKDLYDLGYQVTFHDPDKEGVPSPAQSASHQAVITWFRGATMSDARGYCRWLSEWVDQGKKVVILGNFGAFQDRFIDRGRAVHRWVLPQEYNDFFFPFGLEFKGGWTKDPDALEVSAKDPALVEDDLPLSPQDLKHYFQFRGVHPDNKAFLELRRKDKKDSESQIVVKTPYGGFALESYLFTQDTTTWKMQWRVNMPEFLKEALASKAGPKPGRMPLPDDSLLEIPEGAEEAGYPKYSPALLPKDLPEHKRLYLALFKGSEKQEADKNPLHQFAEQPLNWLGVRLFHYDIEKGLPSPKMMAGFAGVLTWFASGRMPEPEAYWKWLGSQVAGGRRVVILGNPGAFTVAGRGVPARGAGEFFSGLGLRYLQDGAAELEERIARSRSRRRRPPSGLQPAVAILEKDAKMTEFEHPLNPEEISGYDKIVSEASRNRVYLRMSSERIGEFHPVVTGPWGGLADGDFAYWSPAEERAPEKRFKFKWGGKSKGRSKERAQEENRQYEGQIGRWRIDPFRFFEEALGLEGRPRPDVSTLNGSRIFYSHIDGDGFPGISRIDGSNYSAQFVRDEILKKNNLPVTVSVISKDIESWGLPFYNPAYLLAKTIFALPNVEGATHTFSHPFSWRGGDLRVVSKNPLKIARFAIDLRKEIVYSINYINRFLLAPNGKKLKILLWSGDCHPDERAVALVDRMGVRNMNAGDPIYDAKHPTYSTLAALTSQVGGRTQYYTSGRGDFLFTDGWTKNFGGMRELRDHFARTESPKRVSPINIYYHFYIGDRAEGLEGLQAAYDYAHENEVAPLFASGYVDIVKDWMSLRIFKTPEGWRVVNSGDLRTIRFDGAAGRHVDLARSTGVLGYHPHQGSLYVSLDSALTHDIVLAAPGLAAAPPALPYLKQASHYVDGWKADGEGLSLEMRGLGRARLVLRGLASGSAYRVLIRRVEGEAILDKVLRTDAAGGLKVESEFTGYQKRYRVTIKKAS